MMLSFEAVNINSTWAMRQYCDSDIRASCDLHVRPMGLWSLRPCSYSFHPKTSGSAIHGYCTGIWAHLHLFCLRVERKHDLNLRHLRTLRQCCDMQSCCFCVLRFRFIDLLYGFSCFTSRNTFNSSSRFLVSMVFVLYLFAPLCLTLTLDESRCWDVPC